jgi:hypothetical protein
MITSIDSKKKPDRSSMEDDWTVMYCDTTEEVEECITSGQIIWPLIWTAVRRMADEARNSGIVLEIRCAEVTGSVWVTMRSSDVRSTLTKMLKWREGREEYEECAEIVAEIDRWRLIEIYRPDEESPAAPKN